MDKINHVVRDRRTRKTVYWILMALYFLAFGAIFAMLLYKCRYGFADADEPFYLSVPYRVLRGDRFLIHESHLSQFSFIPQLPEMWLYLKIVGNTEGMVLAFRYLYTVIWGAGSLFFYFKARKISEGGARCASLFLLVFAPFGIMAFSYNSMCILFLTNAILLLLCAGRHAKAQFFAAGLFFAAAVLCCPYLALIYFLYSLLLGIARLKKKHPMFLTNGADMFTCWKFFTLGICLLAAIVLAVLLSGGTMTELWEGLSFALRDPDHGNFSLIDKTREYFQSIAEANDYILPLLIIVLGMIILTRIRKSPLWLGVVCAASILYLRRFLGINVNINYLCFPLTFVGIYILAVTGDPKIRQIGFFWLIPGILYTYCINYASSQSFWAISSAATISSLASLVMLWMFCGELTTENHAAWGGIRKSWRTLAAYGIALACFVAQMRYEILVRYQSVYWELGLMKYEEQRTVQEGPEKGIIATVEKVEKCENLYQDAAKINHQKVLFLSEQVWLYLVNDNECAAYSGWLWRVNDFSMGRLQEYYARLPEKKPDVILAEPEYVPLAKRYFLPEEYTYELQESGNYLIRPAAFFAEEEV